MNVEVHKKALSSASAEPPYVKATAWSMDPSSMLFLPWSVVCGRSWSVVCGLWSFLFASIRVQKKGVTSDAFLL